MILDGDKTNLSCSPHRSTSAGCTASRDPAGL